MSVLVKAVTKTGVSGWVLRQCFGFGYSSEGTYDAFAERPEDITHILFKPKHPAVPGTYEQSTTLTPSQAVAFKYYIELVLAAFSGRVELVSPEKGVMSAFTHGVMADVTKLSGPEWVGIFELIRNCQSTPDFVKWVCVLHQMGCTFSQANYLARILALGFIQDDGTITERAFNTPSADTTPSGIFDYSLLYWSRLINSRKMYRPWAEAPDFFGVFHFFHGYFKEGCSGKRREYIRGGPTIKTLPEVVAILREDLGIDASLVTPIFLQKEKAV